jgi:hypothetical protein
MLHSSESNSTI